MYAVSLKSFISFGSLPSCIFISLAHSTIAIAILLVFGTGIPLSARLVLLDFLSCLQDPLILFRYEVEKEDDFLVVIVKHALLFIFDVRLATEKVH